MIDAWLIHKLMKTIQYNIARSNRTAQLAGPYTEE